MTEQSNTQQQVETPFGDVSRRRLIIGGIVAGSLLLLFVIVPAILMAITPHPHGTLYDDPKPQAADFTLPRADGSGEFTLSDTRGKVRVLYFGYTSCPDVCPTTLYDLRNTMEELGDDADEVQVIFITIDPANDTPEKIDAYLDHFDESFIGLYGDEEELAAIRDQYDVVVRRASEGETAANYAITHTNAMFVIDRSGDLTLRLHHDTEVEFLVRDLSYVIKGRL